jgi:hypothetical protein
LVTGAALVHEVEAHHGAADDFAVGAGQGAARRRQQVGHGGADARLEIAGIRHMAGHRHHPGDHGFAQVDRAVEAVGRAHVEDLDAHVGGAAAAGGLDAGQQV